MRPAPADDDSGCTGDVGESDDDDELKRGEEGDVNDRQQSYAASLVSAAVSCRLECRFEMICCTGLAITVHSLYLFARS